jgi:hypothetical protein
MCVKFDRDERAEHSEVHRDWEELREGEARENFLAGGDRGVCRVGFSRRSLGVTGGLLGRKAQSSEARQCHRGVAAAAVGLERTAAEAWAGEAGRGAAGILASRASADSGHLAAEWYGRWWGSPSTRCISGKSDLASIVRRDWRRTRGC